MNAYTNTSAYYLFLQSIVRHIWFKYARCTFLQHSQLTVTIIRLLVYATLFKILPLTWSEVKYLCNYRHMWQATTVFQCKVYGKNVGKTGTNIKPATHFHRRFVFRSKITKP